MSDKPKDTRTKISQILWAALVGIVLLTIIGCPLYMITYAEEIHRPPGYVFLGLASILTLPAYVAYFAYFMSLYSKFRDVSRSTATTFLSIDRQDRDVAIHATPKSQHSKSVTTELHIWPIDEFDSLISRIIDNIDDKANKSNEKASHALDNGLKFAGAGIIFYVIAAVLWQFWIWKYGFETRFIFGIASTTVLFIFVQFIASWFLKQYRHFIEMASYYLEMRTIFDRYHLLHATSRIGADEKKFNQKSFDHLTVTLATEMKWLRSRPTFTKDSYAARDAWDTLTSHLTEVIKSGFAQNKKD